MSNIVNKYNEGDYAIRWYIILFYVYPRITFEEMTRFSRFFVLERCSVDEYH